VRFILPTPAVWLPLLGHVAREIQGEQKRYEKSTRISTQICCPCINHPPSLPVEYLPLSLPSGLPRGLGFLWAARVESSPVRACWGRDHVGAATFPPRTNEFGALSPFRADPTTDAAVALGPLGSGLWLRPGPLYSLKKKN